VNITTRWLFILGIGTVFFGLSLFVLHIPIRTIIVFFVIGLPLVALWLYIDTKSKQQMNVNTIGSGACVCSICGHEQAKICLQEICACCLIMKGNTIVAHSVNALR
jgi:energy-coupling factor transporter transmembrane protein EcfT